MAWSGSAAVEPPPRFLGTLAVRAYVALLVAVVLGAGAFHVLIVERVHRNAFQLEREHARTMTDQLHLDIESDAQWVARFAEHEHQRRVQHLRDGVAIATEIAQREHRRAAAGRVAAVRARADALQQIRGLGAGNHGAVWVVDGDGEFLAHPDPDLVGRDAIEWESSDGTPVLASLLSRLATAAEATLRPGPAAAGTGPRPPRLAYARRFAPWRWIIGADARLDDVDAAIATAKRELLAKLRLRLRESRPVGTGQVFVFDRDQRVLVHPDPAREGSSLRLMMDPATGRSLGEEFVEAVGAGRGRLEYDANGPARGQQMVAWIRHAPALDWFVVAAIDKAGLTRQADHIAHEVTAFATLILLVTVTLGVVVIQRGLRPLKDLVVAADRVGRGDYGFRLSVRRRDDMGVVAAAFNRMLDHIDGDIQGFRRHADELRRARETAEATSQAKERLLHEVRQTQDRLAHLANHDPLTELPNRKLFHEILDAALATSAARGGALAVLFIDLDRFKNVNDSLGHAVGDSLLRAVAARLRHNLRKTDVLARLGGDEFVVLMDPIREETTPANLGQGLLEVLDAPFVLEEGHELYVDASIGISVFPRDGREADMLVRNADAAMYHAKNGGGARIAFYTRSLTAAVSDRLMLETRLRQAIGRNGLRLVYQPVYHLDSGRIAGLEALTRWYDTALGEVPPTRFIPLAEEIGLVTRIGDWAIESACRQLGAWQQRGLGRWRVAVNISGQQLETGRLVDHVVTCLERFDVAGSQLEVELSEAALMSDDAQSHKTLDDLHRLGVVISVDDFGTGHSSLAYLRRFAVNRIKVDRSFVMNIPTEVNDREIVEAVITVAHQLRLEVAAEGVETSAQLEFLRERGCDLAQGYLYSRPLDAAGAADLLWAERVERAAC